MGLTFLPNWTFKKFRPNPIAGCWDDWGFIGHRITVHPRVSEIFLCLISINFPTRFARRGIRKDIDINWLNKSIKMWLWHCIRHFINIACTFGKSQTKLPQQSGLILLWPCSTFKNDYLVLLEIETHVARLFTLFIFNCWSS